MESQTGNWIRKSGVLHILANSNLFQPRPYAAIELIHKQPVRWTHDKVVSCDGGGGPLGHPRIFINTDKPQINWCTYCGIPFVRPELPLGSCGCFKCNNCSGL